MKDKNVLELGAGTGYVNNKFYIINDNLEFEIITLLF